MDSKGQVSPDGQWFWDGQKWMTTLSPDGRFRWDGRQWAAFSPPAIRPTLGAIRQIPGLRTGTVWKLAAGAFAARIRAVAVQAKMQPTIAKAADALMLRTRDIPDKAPSAS